MMVERAVARGHSSASPLKSLMACVAISHCRRSCGPRPPARQDKVIVGLITKTNNNPFFVKMKEGAEAKAKELGVELQSFAGKYRRRQRHPGGGDREPDLGRRQGHPHHRPATPRRSCRPIQKAREAGILVIALDTPLDPIDAADATFATDNFKAGELIGAVGREDTLGDKAKDARIAFLDAIEIQPTVDMLRDQGFMKGFGIDIKDRAATATRTIRASSATSGAPAPRKAAAPAWRTCCRRTRPSASSTPSTSRPRPARTKR